MRYSKLLKEHLEGMNSDIFADGDGSAMVEHCLGDLVQAAKSIKEVLRVSYVFGHHCLFYAQRYRCLYF